MSKSQTGNILVWDSRQAPEGPLSSDDNDEDSDESDEDDASEYPEAVRRCLKAELEWQDSDSYYMKMDMTPGTLLCQWKGLRACE